MYRPFVAPFGALLLISPAFAAAQHADDEIVVTATALRESPLEVAQPTTVLLGRDLRQAPGGSLGESVSRTPGVTGSYFGAAASRPIIRGQSGERVLMLEDGADALDASALSADHAVSVDAFGVDQIEILKGPATLLYGNGAVGGLVNVVTHRVPVTAVDAPSGAAELRGDTALAERSLSLRLDGGLALGDDHSLAFHLDGFDRDHGNLVIPGLALTPTLRESLAAEGVTDTTRDRLPNSASTARGGAFGVSWIAPRGYLGVAISRYETLYGIPGPAEEEGEAGTTAATQWLVEAGPAIDLAQTRLDWRGEWRPEAGPFQALRLRGASNRYRHAETEPDGAIGTRFDNRAHDVRLLADHEHDSWRGTVGVQWRDTDLAAAGEEAFVPPSRTRNLAAFAFQEIDLGSSTVEVGARVEHQKLAVAGGERSETAVGLAAGWLWQWTENLRWSLQATRSQRLPGATELYAAGPHAAVGRYEVGDATLGRETARTVDITLRGANADLTSSWSVGLFAQDFRDYLYMQPAGVVTDGLPEFRYRQGDARFTGLEVEWRHLLRSGTASRAKWELRLAGDTVRGTLRNGGPLPQMPPARLMAGLERSSGAWNARLDLHWTAAQGRVAAAESPTQGGLALDLAVDWTGEWRGVAVSAFLKGSNLLDRDLRRHVSPLKDYVPLPGRGLAAGLRLGF